MLLPSWYLACTVCCAAATKGSANGSAAAMGHLPSVAAAATSKGAASASSSTQDVSSAVGANKFAGGGHVHTHAHDLCHASLKPSAA